MVSLWEKIDWNCLHKAERFSPQIVWSSLTLFTHQTHHVVIHLYILGLTGDVDHGVQEGDLP